MRIPGVYRGLILLLLSIMLLSGICAAVYFTVVKPPDITVNRKPTKPTIVTEVDPETGEEIEMETEVPVSHKEGYYNILIAGTDGDGRPDRYHHCGAPGYQGALCGIAQCTA